MSGTTTSLLPTGYLSTSGGQVIGANGAVVRLQSIAWFGTEGPAGATLVDLPNNNPNDAATQSAIHNTLAMVVAQGFNCVRIPWSDVNLQTALPLFQQIVSQAGQLGLKIVFDHHDNDGHYSQQQNGMWFDTGPGSDGTDGAGTTGTITAAQFMANSVTLAKAFAGNSTVVGFDLDNEPFIGAASQTSKVNWGGGGPTDILAMYNAVGSAVEAADPGVLIVAEGPQNWTGTLISGQAGLSSEGDLSGVATKPVTLTVNGQVVTGKVLYSAHEYPSSIGGEPYDSGSAYIQQMNASWAYLEAQNIAPVWIGEIGASLDGTGSSAGGNLAREQAWAATIVPYLNGQDAAQGGPSVATGYDWWSVGNFPGGFPSGYNSGPNGSINPGQQAVVSQLLTYKGSSAPPITNPPLPPSPNNTVVMAGSTIAIVDAGSNKWTITAGGQVAVNGTVDTTTSNVIELAYVNGAVWQENTSKLWWSKTGPGATWTGGAATSPLPVPPPVVPPIVVLPPVSADNTVVMAGSTAAIVDASGNKWTITAGALVAVNGVADTTTANVKELAYVKPNFHTCRQVRS